jgi:hypothetical protein
MENISTEVIKNKKHKFIFNAIEDGWTVRKEKDLYIFTKEKSTDKNIFSEEYLQNFIIKNLK